MKIECVWEHNGTDTLLYANNLPGAFTRGIDLDSAMLKMDAEVCSYLKWSGISASGNIQLEIVQDAPCELNVQDADSDVLFVSERAPLTRDEYDTLKALTIKSAKDFLELYQSIPNKNVSAAPPRTTFYGAVPRTAEEMYQHTKNVNAYYFGEIGIEADNHGDILDCRQRGFDVLEQQPDFLLNCVFEGSYGEAWTVRKVMRRFIWHDRIHAKAMYRMAVRIFGKENIPNMFCF